MYNETLQAALEQILKSEFEDIELSHHPVLGAIGKSGSGNGASYPRPNSRGAAQTQGRTTLRDHVYRIAFNNSVHTDLQKPLRASNDFVVSYDIVCQLVPKLHVSCHNGACNLAGYHPTPHVAQTDGEGTERDWVNTNRVAAITKEVEEREGLPQEQREPDLPQKRMQITDARGTEVIPAGVIGPISKAAQEWLNHYTAPAHRANQSAPKKDLVTSEQREQRVAYLVSLREAAKKAEAERKAARKADEVELSETTMQHEVTELRMLHMIKCDVVGATLRKTMFCGSRVQDADIVPTQAFFESVKNKCMQASRSAVTAKCFAKLMSLARAKVSHNDKADKVRETGSPKGFDRLGYPGLRPIPKFNPLDWSADDEIRQIISEGLDVFEHRKKEGCRTTIE
ncbi:hypothetical protein C8R45DRAFT_934135 [Mycena sanguinolenta]|nr:hypothetical protein C8R45DRAFT_934135 [Mycena sanguinolenta]